MGADQRRHHQATSPHPRRCSVPMAAASPACALPRTGDGGRSSWCETGEGFVIPADMVLKAIGQTYRARAGGWGKRRSLADPPGAGPVDALATDEVGQHLALAQGVGWRRLPCQRARPDRGGRGARQGGRHLHPPPRWLLVSARSACHHRTSPEHRTMADIRSNFLGIQQPQSRSGWPRRRRPTRKYNVTARLRGRLGRRGLEDPGRGPFGRQRQRPALLQALILARTRHVIGLNNIELITDRPLHGQSRAEIKRVKRNWPDRAMIVSLMVPCDGAELEEHPAPGRGHRLPMASS